jgi:predicted esterase
VQTPLLQCHGDRDQVVSIEHGRRGFKVLTEEAKVNGKFLVYKNMAHSSSDAEMRDVEEFIVKQLGTK